jgi:hypothetical protein
MGLGLFTFARSKWLQQGTQEIHGQGRQRSIPGFVPTACATDFVGQDGSCVLSGFEGRRLYAGLLL